MTWLLFAILAEVVATSMLPSTDGFRVPVPTVLVVALYITAFALLSQAVRTVAVSTAYAIWSGLGTAAVAMIGFMLLDERASPARVVGIALVIAGVVLLQMSEGAEIG